MTHLVQIERIQPDRYKIASELMAYGFGHKFQRSTSMSLSDLATAFEQMLHHVPQDTGNLRVVAREDDVIVGTMSLKWKSDSHEQIAGKVRASRVVRLQSHRRLETPSDVNGNSFAETRTCDAGMLHRGYRCASTTSEQGNRQTITRMGAAIHAAIPADVVSQSACGKSQPESHSDVRTSAVSHTKQYKKLDDRHASR